MIIMMLLCLCCYTCMYYHLVTMFLSLYWLINHIKLFDIQRKKNVPRKYLILDRQTFTFLIIFWEVCYNGVMWKFQICILVNTCTCRVVYRSKSTNRDSQNSQIKYLLRRDKIWIRWDLKYIGVESSCV